MFKKLKPQKVKHISKGYIVQSKSKYYIEYIDGSIIALVEVDQGLNDIIVLKDRIFINGNKASIMKSEVIARSVAKGLQAMGLEVVSIE